VEIDWQLPGPGEALLASVRQQLPIEEVGPLEC
jgi:hypothetical protein